MRSEDGSFENAKLRAIATKTTFTDRVEKPGVIYHYFIISGNSYGDGAISNPCAAAASPVGKLYE